MTPEERLAELERKIDVLAAAIGRLEAALARWLAVLPDPDTIKARLGRRRMARTAAELLSDE